MKNFFFSYSVIIWTLSLYSQENFLNSSFQAVALQSSNNYAVAGGTAYILGIPQFLIARYDTSGQLDTTFNSIGYVTTSFATVGQLQAIATYGSQVIGAGYCVSQSGTSICLVRYNNNGSIDTNFGSSGIVNTSIGNGANANDIAIQNDNTILIAGSAVINGTPQFALVSYTSSGVLNNAFGSGGIVTTQIDNSYSSAQAMVIDASSNVILVGTAGNNIAIARYTSGGILDTTFNSSGRTNISISTQPVNPGIIVQSVGSVSQATDVGLQTSGKIIVLITSDSYMGIIRYNTDGSLDTTFGNQGIALLQSLNYAVQSTAMIIQNNDDIVIMGNSSAYGIFARFTANGILDTTFGVNGINIYNPLGATLLLNDIITDNNQNFILVSALNNSTVIGRLLTSGFTDITYGQGGTQFAPGNEFNNSIGNMVRVDTIFGDDELGEKGITPFKTISAALNSAPTGYVISIDPGTYHETITIPAGIAIQGVSANQVTIQQLGVTGATNLVTMGENSQLENVTLSLNSAADVPLNCLVLPGTTTATSHIKNIYMGVSNTGAGPTGASSVCAILSSGTGQPPDAYNCIRDVVASITATGSGNIVRGILLDSANICNIRDSFFTISGTTGCIGVETNFTGASATIRNSFVSGQGADISQTNGQIILLATQLDTINANGLGFTSQVQPSMLVWADSGTLPTGISYMRPGTGTSSATAETQIRATQNLIIKGLSIKAQTAPGTGNTDTWTLRKNGQNTSLTISLSGAQTNNVTLNTSVSFMEGDLISLETNKAAGSATADVVVVMDIY